jgi:2'-5' RNA ligase
MAASPTPDRRLFVGTFVPPALHDSLLAAREAVAGAWRWTRPEQWHLTLNFLGDVADGRVPELIAVLKDLAGHAPLSLTAAGWEGFPRRQRAHVLVRDVTLTEPLERLQAHSATLVAPWLARPEKKTYRPHITLGRSRQGLPVTDLAVPALDWVATDVHLIESRLSPSGSSYVILATVALGGDP